jgi:hypothetical protein
VFGDGPDGESGPVPPAPAGAGFELWRRTVSAARLATTSTAAVGPTVATVVTMWAGVSLNARNPATTFAGLAAVGDGVDAVAEDEAWSATDPDAGVPELPN